MYWISKIGSLAYYVLMMHRQPDVAKRMCVVVQLGYEPIGAQMRSQAFDSISFTAKYLQDIGSEDKRAAAAMEDIQRSMRERDAVMVVFQAKRVVYEEEDKEGVKVRKQSFIGETCSLWTSVIGVADKERPLFNPRRQHYLFEQIKSKIRSPL
jgi:hypothetical protein